ncbi:MAG: ATP-binding cassette domain-containing protein [Planctomycetota bacterium]
MLWSLSAVSLSGRRVPRLDRVTVEIPRGVTAVLGQSGAGKTSLLNVLVGFERPNSGRVEFRGASTEEKLGVFWSPSSHGLWPHLTVREHLITVGRSDVAELLARFDLAALADAKPGSLSLGERSRLSVARALASGARVLVMDEPLSHVDEARVDAYWKVIREQCAAAGTSLVFATHSPEVALREASHVVCLAEGRLSYTGSVEELYEQPSSPELAHLLGPCNWMTSGDEQRWLTASPNSSGNARMAGRLETDPTGATCVRPERLGVEASANGSLKVEAARFAGASAEVDLVDERDGVRRTFVHRPVGQTLKTGDRVLLKVLMLLLAMLLVPGCDSGAEPTLHVKHEDYWSMPPDGPRVPAPRGMTVSPQGEYLVLDNAGRVLVFDETGAFQRHWWMPEYSVGKPEGICVLKDGRIVVADTHYHRVVFFDHEGHVTGMFGQLGTKPGEFIYPVSVIQDDAENLYVCEYGNYNDRVQKFGPDGTFLAQIGGYGTGDGQFQRPSGMALLDGRLYVTDAFNNRIQVFGENGKLVAILGESDRISDLHYPYDIAANEQGELFVVEYGAGRVSKFDRTGKLLGRYGHTGTQAAQFSTPWGLAVDKRGRVYVCDTGNRRIVELEL